MNLLDLVNRHPPRPWLDGEKIPWNEPGFSARMLREHLSQEHDAASRRAWIIDQHVAWIHQHVLSGIPSRILDLGCGPGLYLSRLARLGHQGTGIDFSPASLDYARREAAAASLPITYRLEDLRSATFAYDDAYDTCMLLFGEFNTFRHDDAHLILSKAYAALCPGGRLLLEPSTYESILALGVAGPTWYAAGSGLWSDRPYICMQDNAWDAEHHISVERYALIDADTGTISQHAMTTQAYRQDEVVAMLADCGFAGITLYPSLLGHADAAHQGLYAVLAQKPG